MNEFDYEKGVAVCEDFNAVYSSINERMLLVGNNQNSRNGNIVERLNFKTELLNPRKRCVAGFERNINVFFLLAEAMWIWAGRKDVGFLTQFNSGMVNFSDDGENFHAPYGFRMRHHGVNSFEKHTGENKHVSNGFDQFPEALSMLAGKGKGGDGKDTRRAVIQIWNADLDLNVKSKDLPCNDLFFLQHRDGELHGTIANRSNDLHWGLPTNIFQFSFILEAFSLILGYEVGTQCHNSKSLHIYTDNPIANKMYTSTEGFDLYSKFNTSNFDYNFKSYQVTEQERLSEFDRAINVCLHYIENPASYCQESRIELGRNSKFLKSAVDFLLVYVKYKNEVEDAHTQWLKDACRMRAFKRIYEILDRGESVMDDILVLGLNFFYKRIEQTYAEFDAEFGEFVTSNKLGYL